MRTPDVVLVAMIGLMACPAVARADSAEDARIRQERFETILAMAELMALATSEDKADRLFEVMLAAEWHQPIQRSGLDARWPEEPSEQLWQRRRLSNVPSEGATEVPDGRPSRDEALLRYLELFAAAGEGWSEGTPGNRPPVRSTPEPAPAASPSRPTTADFERLAAEAAGVYQSSVAAMQQNVADWQRRQEAIQRTQEMIEQTGNLLRQQQEDWSNRHPQQPAPPPTASRPPPATPQTPPATTKPPSQPGKPGAASSGGQRSGSRTGGTVKRTDKPQSGGVKNPAPAPQSHRCQKCGRISPAVFYCPKCHKWHCPGQ